MSNDGSLCVIPARGGSRRIPRKNVRTFAGVPAIARTIETVATSGVADRIVVSTDDEEIAAVSRSAGAETPFIRRAELADDHTPTIPVVGDAIDRLAELGGGPFATTWVVYPTAVLIEPDDLVRASEARAAAGARVAMSVVSSRAPIERAWRRAVDGRGHMVSPDHAATRTQDLPVAYFDAGQFYVATTEFWTSGVSLADASPLLVPLPLDRAIDIDDEADWSAAEALFAARSSGS